MHPHHDLRGRVALFFAGFGALVSVIMAVVLYQAAHDLGQRLIVEALSKAEEERKEKQQK